MDTLTIKRCSLADIEAAPSLPALLAEYGVESSIEGLGAQNMQGDTYRALESAGMLHIVGAWVGEELAGFIAVLVSVLPHYGKTVCVSESYFVAAAHRKTGAGLLLLKEAERIGEERGAVGFLLSAPKGGRLARVLPAHSYSHVSEVFFKQMGQVAVLPESLPAMTGEAVDRVRLAEAQLMELPQIDIPTRHALHAGMYARTITIPAGAAITGALIKIPTILIVDGHCEVFTGSETVVLTGYHVMQAEAHRKQVFLAYADTNLTMLFPTQAETVKQAENEFTDEAALLWSRRIENQGERKCLVE